MCFDLFQFSFIIFLFNWLWIAVNSIYFVSLFSLLAVDCFMFYDCLIFHWNFYYFLKEGDNSRGRSSNIIDRQTEITAVYHFATISVRRKWGKMEKHHPMFTKLCFTGTFPPTYLIITNLVILLYVLCSLIWVGDMIIIPALSRNYSYNLKLFAYRGIRVILQNYLHCNSKIFFRIYNNFG